MSRMLRTLAAPARRAVAAAQPRLAFAAAAQQARRSYVQLPEKHQQDEQSEFTHSRDMLLGLAGCSVFIAYAVHVLAGEPAHEEEHPFYAAPYNFSKRTMELGAGWWPGRHCQLFEMNCFADSYKEADELLKEAEKESYSKKH